MSPRSLALALAVLLTVSMLIVLVPTQAHPAPAVSPRASAVRDAVHPAASITATILNGYDIVVNTFYAGTVGWGSFYFAVTDPLDQAVNVTITDPNATRDGVGTPAFHYEATLSATTSTYNSYTAGVHYAFPASIPYAGHWTVNFSAPKGGYLDENVSLLIYYTSARTTTGISATLPGMTFGVFWAVYLYSNEISPYTHVTSVTIWGSYTGNGTVRGLFSSKGVSLTPGINGEWTGTVPANTTPNTQLHFEVSAVTNVSGHVVENESANVTVNVGAIYINGVGVTTLPPNCALVNDVFFTAGSTIAGCIQVGADYLGTFTAISGLPISIGYWNGTKHVTPVGAPTSLTSNVSGEAAFTFVANIPPFIGVTTTPGYDALNFSVHVPGTWSLPYQWYAWDNATWALESPTAYGVVQLTLDHTTYYPGMIATATWSISSTNFTKTGALTAEAWQARGPNGITYAQGALNTTGSTGSFSVPITGAMATQTVEIVVYVANATQTFVGMASANVLNPSLLLTPASYYYNAGSSTSISVLLNGGGAGATITYQAWEYWSFNHAQLSNGTVANGSSIPITIPSSVPPASVVVDVWATAGGQVIASASTEILLAQGYSIEFGVSTVSSYSDGSFQPGQTVTLTYQVVSVGGAALPQVISFELFALGYPYIQVLPNVGPSGSVPFTVPSNAPQGTILIELLARGTLSAGTCFPTGGCDSIVALYVNPSPSVLNLELGAGSGLTVGWLILLILIAVVAVVLFVVIRRRGGRRTKPSPTSSSTGAAPVAEWKEPPPPTPAPEQPPAAEPATSDSPPPLPPQPPAGAT